TREPDTAAKLHQSPAHGRRQLVETKAVRIELDDAVDRVEGIGQRKMPNAAAGDRRASGEHGLAQRAVDRRRELRTPRAANVTEETLQDPEIGVANRLQRDALVAQSDPP